MASLSIHFSSGESFLAKEAKKENNKKIEVKKANMYDKKIDITETIHTVKLQGQHNK